MSREQNSGSQGQKKKRNIKFRPAPHPVGLHVASNYFFYFFLALSKDQMWHLLSWGAGIIKGGDWEYTISRQ